MDCHTSTSKRVCHEMAVSRDQMATEWLKSSVAGNGMREVCYSCSYQRTIFPGDNDEARQQYSSGIAVALSLPHWVQNIWLGLAVKSIEMFHPISKWNVMPYGSATAALCNNFRWHDCHVMHSARCAVRQRCHWSWVLMLEQPPTLVYSAKCTQKGPKMCYKLYQSVFVLSINNLSPLLQHILVYSCFP